MPSNKTTGLCILVAGVAIISRATRCPVQSTYNWVLPSQAQLRMELCFDI
ncbi:MAG: hypothetical protein GY746_17050 [Gammaproteobacteria bacterium]|nr:hypothetical protein [Gammaproteobacteria bacterium]